MSLDRGAAALSERLQTVTRGSWSTPARKTSDAQRKQDERWLTNTAAAILGTDYAFIDLAALRAAVVWAINDVADVDLWPSERRSLAEQVADKLVRKIGGPS